MLVDSGTTSHMTAYGSRVHSQRKCDTSIHLADDSTVSASKIGVRKVTWQGTLGSTTVSLSNTLVAPNIKTSLLSVPALVNKDIAVLFVPGKALFIDMLQGNTVIGYAKQRPDGLFYIPDKQHSIDVNTSGDDKTVRAMMATARVVNRTEAESESATDGQSSKPAYSEGKSEQTCDEDKANRDGAETKESTDSETTASSGTSNQINSVSNFDGEMDDQPSGLSARDKAEQSRVWHLRLGHVLNVRQIRRHITDVSLPLVKPKRSDCEACLRAKYRKAYSGSLTKATTIGHLHADVKGMIKDRSVGGAAYFVIIVDEFSRFVQAVPIGKKSEASREVLQFAKWFERQTGSPVRSFYSDGGKEFLNAREALKDQGVDVDGSTPYTPQSNGLAERHVGIILTAALAALLQAKLPMKYWDHAVRHVAWCKNMVRHGKTGETPYSLLMGNPFHDIYHVRPFGCRMLYHPVTARIPPFDSRLREGVCLGHTAGGIYKVLTDSGIVRTKHVREFEDEFPSTARLNFDTRSDTEKSVNTDSDVMETSIAVSSSSSSDNNSGTGDDTSDEDINADSDVNQLEQLTYTPLQPSVYGEEADQSEEESDGEDESDGDLQQPRPQGLRNIPRVDYSAAALPKWISTSDEPTLSAVLKSPERKFWLSAINDEFSTLTDLGTWEEVPAPPPHVQVLPAGIVFRLKRDEEGLPSRFKARVVARGDCQQEEFEYGALYAPVACAETVRILLAVSAVQGWVTDHVDVKGAFLNALLPETDRTFMRLPSIPGVSAANGQIVKLVKSIYGLRQAPKLWYQAFARVLQSVGFRRSSSNDCLFIRNSKDQSVYLLVYVDDIILAGQRDAVDDVKKMLAERFKITDLGNCTHFLGFKIDRTAFGIFLSQRPFTEKIISLAGLGTSKPTASPLPLSHTLYELRRSRTEEEEQFMGNVPYRRVLGSLLFLSTRTRPDISTAVSMLGKFQDSPLPEHWTAMKSVVQYLVGTKKYGLRLPFGEEAIAEAWADADCAREKHKRRSRSGYLVTIAGGPVLWTSRLQSLTAQSTTEAEFVALSQCVKDVIWIRDTLTEFGCKPTEPTRLHEDNLGTVAWTSEVQGMRHSKHIGIRYHYVRDAVVAGTVVVCPTPSDENKADGLTKVLVKAKFQNCRSFLGCVCIDDASTRAIEEAC